MPRLAPEISGGLRGHRNDPPALGSMAELKGEAEGFLGHAFGALVPNVTLPEEGTMSA